MTAALHELAADHAAVPLPVTGAQRVLFYELHLYGLSADVAARCVREVDLAPGQRWQLAALRAHGVDSIDAETLLALYRSRCADCGDDLPSRTTCVIDHHHSRAYCCPCGIRRRLEQSP